MGFDQYIRNRQLFIFELDDVLFPAKDYLLQVYYLYAQFIEYSLQRDAAEIIGFMKATYEQEGKDDLFEKTASKFNIPEQYRQNFDLLHLTARLPLKLLLYKNMLAFLQELVEQGKKIIVVTDGDPAQQLNKIRQMEWNGLEKHLTVFFTEEFKESKSEIFLNLLRDNNLSVKDALAVGANNLDESASDLINLPYIESLKIYS